MTDPESGLRHHACLEGLDNQLDNLVEVIANLVDLMNAMPEGPHRAKLLDMISCLDVILEVMRKAAENLKETKALSKWDQPVVSAGVSHRLDTNATKGA